MENLIDRFGEGPVLFVAALLIGLIFGAAAQHSRFCLRAATIELSQQSLGPRMAVWFLAFNAAFLSVQALIALGYLDVSLSRQIAATGSLSGAIIGGLMFGVGMILARGCASRLLVLSATGNLRAIVTGLILTLAAQASLRGFLSPAREYLASLWQISGGAPRDLTSQFGLSSSTLAGVAALALVFSIFLAVHRSIRPSRIAAAIIVGLAVGGGWWATYLVASHSFEVVAVSSVTFTGPSTDTLMGLINERGLPLEFGSGLVPGVFISAGLMALATKEAQLQRFGPDTPMESYLLGGVLMGFGSMLAGGCAVGAGMSGGAIFALTAWLALFCMWIGAVTTHLLVHRRTPAVPGTA